MGGLYPHELPRPGVGHHLPSQGPGEVQGEEGVLRHLPRHLLDQDGGEGGQEGGVALQDGLHLKAPGPKPLQGEEGLLGGGGPFPLGLPRVAEEEGPAPL